jgi:hypothetical protein
LYAVILSTNTVTTPKAVPDAIYDWLGRVNRGLRGFYIARRICGPFQQTMIAKFVGSSTRTE